MKRVILASASPRRKELLAQMGISYEIMISDIDEQNLGAMPPDELVQTLAHMKAKAVADKIDDHAIIIGADTIVVFENQVLGKPKNTRDAKKTLRMLSGNMHIVYTGVAVIDTRNNHQEVFAVDTKVYMKYINEVEIEKYIQTGEPLDKAGSYGIQGRGGVFIERIDGDYFSVMGLPISKLYSVLKSHLS